MSEKLPLWLCNPVENGTDVQVLMGAVGRAAGGVTIVRDRT